MPKNVSMTLQWYSSIWIKPNWWGFFSQVELLPSPGLFEIFRFNAISGIMKVQLLTMIGNPKTQIQRKTEAHPTEDHVEGWEVLHSSHCFEGTKVLEQPVLTAVTPLHTTYMDQSKTHDVGGTQRQTRLNTDYKYKCKSIYGNENQQKDLLQLYQLHQVRRGRGTWRNCRSISAWLDPFQKSADSAPLPWKRGSLLGRVKNAVMLPGERLAWLGPTQSGRWSSWTSWYWGKTGSLWWWTSAGASSWSPTTFQPRARSAEGLPEGSSVAPPAGWGTALPSCWISVWCCEDKGQTKKMRESELKVSWFMISGCKAGDCTE